MPYWPLLTTPIETYRPFEPKCQSCTWSHSAFAALMAEDNFRAAITAAPRFCTVSRNWLRSHASSERIGRSKWLCINIFNLQHSSNEKKIKRQMLQHEAREMWWREHANSTFVSLNLSVSFSENWICVWWKIELLNSVCIYACDLWLTMGQYDLRVGIHPVCRQSYYLL